MSTTETTELVDVISNMCAIDIRPFAIVEGIGFRKLAEKLIAIGAKHGNLSVDDVLPSARTVSRHVHSVADK
jgi:hypothetical protein